MSNQRQHERIEIVLPIVLSHGGIARDLQTKNVSVGGCLIEGGTDLPYGAAVLIRMALPGGEVELPATVRWVRDGVVGVQFGSLRAKETRALQQLVKTLQQK